MSDTCEWYDPLLKKYPILFKELKYISCSEGWYQLIDNLASVIEHHLNHSVPFDVRYQIYAVQVKQKFAGLRFYMNHETPFISGAIQMAEAQSLITCEKCGGIGSERNVRNWIMTLCDSDFEKEKSRVF